ncbi:hypothetical protein PsalMR5_04246 (plasmid) [Piscirickettsia salmonis]|nr:hypothetical protein PsalSR1_04245 [Piscirickettsia salmonis]QGP61627.1 hypothetical protein PsalBI1_04269 [Piscirickettsia salmonis]QGP66321.1 hypothetical protein PsalMR5_04246 [Piscirickettsia salmonis]
MSSVGACLDNAPVERFFGSLKGTVAKNQNKFQKGCLLAFPSSN